jgi:hypothetical protein
MLNKKNDALDSWIEPNHLSLFIFGLPLLGILKSIDKGMIDRVVLLVSIRAEKRIQQDYSK